MGGQGTVLEDRSVWSPLLWSLRVTGAARIAAKPPMCPQQPHPACPFEGIPQEFQLGNTHTAQESTDKSLPLLSRRGADPSLYPFSLCQHGEKQKRFLSPLEIPVCFNSSKAACTVCLTLPLVGMFRHYQTLHWQFALQAKKFCSSTNFKAVLKIKNKYLKGFPLLKKSVLCVAACNLLQNSILAVVHPCHHQ